MTLDRAQAGRFLRLIDPVAKTFTLQTFDDNRARKASNLARVLELDRLNGEVKGLHSAGAGIFLTINKADGKGRKTENITRVRAVWQEDDNGYEGEFPLAPSIVVETSEGHFHRYWLISDEWPADEKGRADFAAVMGRMVASYGCDNSAKDLARVLRIPGFWHQKDPANRQLVRIVAESGKRYTRAEILAAFPPVEKPKSNGHANGHTKWQPRSSEGQRIHDALEAIPSDDREEWLHIGMALKSELGDAGFDPWWVWSRRSSKFDDADCRRVWASLKPEGGITIGTLFGLAKDHGWREGPRIIYGSAGDAQPRGQANGAHHDAPRGAAKPAATLVSHNASEIKMQNVEWLWPGRIAIGKHSAIAGEPGVGKSTLLFAIAASVTTGGEWPCGEGRAPKGSVVILSAEDDAADTIVPRLKAAGADLTKVHIIRAVNDESGGVRSFNLQADLPRLSEKIAELGDCHLAVIDPISSYMGKVDSHKNSESRGVIEPLSEMAARLRVAILSNTHFSKTGAASKSRALHRIIGSIAFVGAPRAVYAIVQDPTDDRRRLMLCVKNNIAATPRGLAYTLEQAVAGYEDDGPVIHATRVVWAAEPVEMTADEAIVASEAALRGGATTATPEREEAKSFLQELLANGPMSSEAVMKEAKRAAISEATLRRAKAALGVNSLPDKVGGVVRAWNWHLPTRCSPGPDAHVTGVEHVA